MMGVKSFLRRFKVLRNLNYLLRHDLEGACKVDDISMMLDAYKYELDLPSIQRPNIKSPEETIHDIIEQKASICRFGDGEFALMWGEGIPFQDYSPGLARRLHEVFNSDIGNIFVCINYWLYSPRENVHDFPKRWVRVWLGKNIQRLGSVLREGKLYHSADFTSMYTGFKHYDFEKHFALARKIFEGRDITIICGNTVFAKTGTKIFDEAKSVEYLYAPSKNAFADYDKLLNEAAKIDKDRLIVIILGPTATVLAYDLALKGYQALDIGHIAKDYDAYLKNVLCDEESILKFFQPD